MMSLKKESYRREITGLCLDLGGIRAPDNMELPTALLLFPPGGTPGNSW